MRRRYGFAVLALAVAIGLAACGGDGDNGDGAATPVLGDAAIKSATVVAQTDASTQPVDAAPSPDGSIIYYLTTGDSGAALLKVASAAGSTPQTLAQGAPLVKPTGVAVASDGTKVYVADQDANQDSIAGAKGGVLVASTSAPATPTLVAGTEGRSPHGVDVVSERGVDVVYFTGTDPATGTPGLFRVVATGGTPETVAEGPPFVAPDSVVVGAGSVAYVTDQGAGSGKGLVVEVRAGKATQRLSDLRLGSPAGVTLGTGDGVLLVSSIDPASSADQVLFYDLATGQTAAATKVIGANKASAGGLHRADAAAVLGWADVLRPGRVYRVEI
jgi:hypothetical protein